MNFTWHASAYDVGDIPYKLLVFVQISGALVFAAGLSDAFSNSDFSLAVTGFVVMRLAMAAQWLRVALAVEDHRPAAIRYAVGISIMQVFWIILFLLPESILRPGFVVLIGR